MIKKLTPYLLILCSLLFVGFGIKYNLFESEPQEPLSLKSTASNLCKKNRITIENGCGMNNLGRIYKKYLLSKDYDVDKFIDASNFGHTATKIYFHKGNKDCALKLAENLGVKANEIYEKNNLDYYHDLTLVLGQDYRQLNSYNDVKKYNPFK